MSSLETTAAPWRANACRASLFPAPMPPVIAMATRLLGLLLVRDGRFGRNGLVPGGRFDLVGDIIH